MARNRVYVWAAPCPACGVGKDQACRSLVKGSTRLLYGRRTHPERRQKVREMGNPKVHPTRSTLRYASATAIQYTQAANTIYLAAPQITGTYATGGLVMTGNITATTTAGWTVTRDEMWNTWIATQTTTTGDTIRWGWTDEQQVVWNNWNTRYPQPAEILPRHEAMQVINDEMQRQREAENRRLLAEAQERQQLAAEANERALELFLMLLTAEQRVQWHEEEAVTVRGSEGGLYEIRSGGVHGNITQIDEHGCRLATLCVAPRMYDYEEGDRSGRYSLPTPDGWVGQLLAIRHNELELVRHANFSYRRACQYPEVPIIGERVA